MNQFRALTATLDLGNSHRRLTYRGKPHVFASAIGMVGDLVVTGLYSQGPEFVPAEVLAAGAQSFVGKPIFTFHPEGGAASAAGYSFGEVATATFAGNALRFSLYFDPAAAIDVEGEEGEAGVVIRRVLNDELIAISIGAWVVLEEVRGYASGSIYDYRWAEMAGDHVAVSLLAHGGIAACPITKCAVNRDSRSVWAVNTSSTEVHAAMCDQANCSCHVPPDPWGVPPALARALGIKSSAPVRRPTPASLAAALRLAGPGSTLVDGRVLDAARIPNGYATAALVYNNG